MTTKIKPNRYYYFETDPFTVHLNTGSKKIPTTKRYFLDNAEKFQGCNLLFRGFKDRNCIKLAYKYNIPFYYMDSGYVGNFLRKIYIRVAKNDVQTLQYVPRAPDRLSILFDIIKKNCNVSPSELLLPWNTAGEKILICPIDELAADFYNLNANEWQSNIINTLQTYTNKEIEIRTRPKDRGDRIFNDTIFNKLKNGNIFCVVTYNSVVAVDSVITGIPAFTLGPNAAGHVSLSDLSQINAPIYPDRDDWLSHIAYCQFTKDELIDGTAWKVLNEY